MVDDDGPGRPSRRKILRAGVSMAAGAALGVPSVAAAQATPQDPAPLRRGETMADVPFAPHEVVRVGLVGCGGRGMLLLGDLLNVPGVEVRAVGDVRPERARRSDGAGPGSGQGMSRR